MVGWRDGRYDGFRVKFNRPVSRSTGGPIPVFIRFSFGSSFRALCEKFPSDSVDSADGEFGDAIIIGGVVGG